MKGGWSSHFEFRSDKLRVRTDFFTRPPRVSAADLARMWKEQEGRDRPFVDARMLADMKKTNRERDYAVIGELARLLPDPRDRLLYSRSARDLIELQREHPDLATEMTKTRALLAHVSSGREKLEEALDAERRSSMRTNEERLEAYRLAARALAKDWLRLSTRMEGRSLLEAHRIFVEAATPILPTQVSWKEPR
jgi:hypothetical protein